MAKNIAANEFKRLPGFFIIKHHLNFLLVHILSYYVLDYKYWENGQSGCKKPQMRMHSDDSELYGLLSNILQRHARITFRSSDSIIFLQNYR